MCRYITVTLKFLTNELGFENESDCREFLESHGVARVIDTTNSAQVRVRVKEGATVFEELRAAAFKSIDIKGQI